MADAHRRLADAEHALEERMKGVAPHLPDAELFQDAADRLSTNADTHRSTADRIDRPGTSA